ncbi:Ig-like domain-containing protein [Candidatus Uhrbacteria bacterium]|jgi:hypothetical protein|nr:Ig-like domain-containing protein [Candidatus Uhrbacteria bacterium]MBT7717525.1 Ig-like domain-containing protein [Candidatus Uhrbacteria bacterium]
MLQLQGESPDIWTMNDAVPVTLASSTINSNVQWTNMTTLSIDASSTINANERGCVSAGTYNGYGPDGSNVCTLSTAGYGAGFNATSKGVEGAGHGGTGGAGSTTSGAGATYGSNTAPVLLGSSGGNVTAAALGGSGGGLVRLDVSGSFTHNGSITADGGDGGVVDTGDKAAGGGSGGSIYVTAGSVIEGGGATGTFSADGGAGANDNVTDGGGGGGGRVRVGYGADADSLVAGLSAGGVAAGGAATGTAVAGSTGTLSTADIYGPSISTAVTNDADADGQIDTIVLTLSEDVTGGTVAGADFTLSDSYTVASASRTADSQITIVVTEKSNDGDTEVVPTVTIAGSIDDTSANSTTSGSKASTDGAKPRISAIKYRDQDADGKIDVVTLNFSESLDAASSISQNDLLVYAVGDFTGAAFNSETNDLFMSPDWTIQIPLATEATVVDTKDDSGTFEIRPQKSFSITDGTNTNTDTGELTHISPGSYGDEAQPVITSIAPADAETSVSASEDIVVVFSEAMNTGSTTYTITADPGGASEAWTVSDTTLTISHDQFQGSTDYIFEVTAAPDVAANALAGTVSGVTNPATFSIASAGGVSVSSSAPDPSIGSGSEDNPVDSISESSSASGTCEEGFNPGENIALAWASNSSVNLVNLYYSTDDGDSYTLIEGPITNTENYTWTIPTDIVGSTLQFKIEGTDLAEITATFETESCALNGADDGTEDDTIEDPTSEVTEPTTGEQGYSPVTGEVEDISVTEVGDYIRSSYFSTVYYLDTDTETNEIVRRPFMDAQTFFTYQDNFDNVKTVTDATLTTITLGYPMLPNPGVVLIKIQSDPKVYAIDSDGTTIRWIASEEVANTLYGDDWSQYIIDIEATFFPRFTQGGDVDEADDIDLMDRVMKRRSELSQ